MRGGEKPLMSDWIASVLDKLERLRTADPEFELFGAGLGDFGHHYRLGPRLTPTWLAHLEKLYGVELPSDYRRFLLEAGNGGAGPYYGLQRFGYLEAPEQAPVSFGTGILHETITSWGCTVVTEERYTPAGARADPFDGMFYDSLRGLAGAERRRLARPFPLVASCFFSEEEPDAGALAEGPWAEPGQDAFRDGVFVLAEYGCGIFHLLVVTGPARGSVWSDDRCNCDAILRIADSFAAWYEAWLDDMLVRSERLGREPRTLRKVAPIPTPFPET
jgi:hypothetical protein